MLIKNNLYYATVRALCVLLQAFDSVTAIEEVLQRPVTPSQLKGGGDAHVVHVQPRSRYVSTIDGYTFA